MAVISLEARVFSASVHHFGSGVGPGNEVASLLLYLTSKLTIFLIKRYFRHIVGFVLLIFHIYFTPSVRSILFNFTLMSPTDFPKKDKPFPSSCLFPLFQNGYIVHNLLNGNKFDFKAMKVPEKTYFHMKDCAPRILSKQRKIKGNSEMTYFGPSVV